MTQPPYLPPPPPPPPSTVPKDEFHGPRTDFFHDIRVQLAALEQQTRLKSEEIAVGCIIALIASAVVGVIISLIVQMALLGVGMEVLMVIVAPLSEELSKGLGVFIVAFSLWRTPPNRRYGAALGAVAGLGFGMAESILFIFNLGLSGELILVRILITPLAHLLFSAFMGIGVFAFAANRSAFRRSSKTSSWLLPLFLTIGIVNHMIWNGLAVLLQAQGYLAIVLDAVVILPLFAVILRDFLGGHFNFQHFFEPLPEPSRHPVIAPLLPPPPPPPPQSSQ